MMLPGIIALLIFSYGPMFGLAMAFVDYSPARGIQNSPWVGFYWFNRAFENPFFWVAVRNTLIIKGLQTLIGFPTAIILALLLNEVRVRWFKSVVQTATFLPYFISWAIVASMFQNILGTDGVVNQVIVNVFGGTAISFLTTPSIFRWIIVLQDTWKWCGYFTVLYLANIASIDQSLYEAAMVDGAGRFRQALHITIPALRTTMATLLIILIGYLISGSFEQVFTMINISVYSTGDIIETFIFRLGLRQAQYSFATAVGLMQGIIAFFLVLTMNKIMKKLSQEGIF